MPRTSTNFEPQWVEMGEWIENFIKGGAFDSEIQAIAKACFERRDYLKTEDAKRTKIDRSIIPTGEVLPDSVRLQAGKMMTDNNPAPAKPTRTRRTLKKKAEEAAPTDPAKPRSFPRSNRRFGNVPAVFRYTDGNLYRKDEIRGKIVEWVTIGMDGGAISNHVKIVGVGNAAKIVPVNEKGTPATPYEVPSEWLAEDGKIKDPLFIDIRAIDPIVKKLKPVEEGSK